MPDLAEFLRCVPSAQWLGPGDPTTPFASVSTDSRSLEPGALFIALSGPHFDGAAFVTAAAKRGAAAAVVQQVTDEHRALGLPMVRVDDGLAALTQWAVHWRHQWPGRVAAVCGSNGKTTVKQMIAAVFAQAVGPDHAWATPGNRNNHIGVPLSVLGLAPAHRLAVLELGMNHPGEIAALTAIAQPQVAVVTNAQREHQEFMKSVAAVAEENGAVFAALPANGTAIFPRDPSHEPIWRRQIGMRPSLRFGFADAPADRAYSGPEVTGRWAASSESDMAVLQVSVPGEDLFELHLQGVGDHFALNALAATACAWAHGIAVPAIVAALNGFAPVKGRGQRHPLAGGGVVIDDSYNANPDSVRAAIDGLVHLPAPRGLVLGDMGEVGDHESAFHQEVLRYACDRPIDTVWLHGRAFAQASADTGLGVAVAEMPDLIGRVQQWSAQAQRCDTPPSVWVKGSRFMAMERVVKALVSQEGEVHPCC